MVTSAMAGLPGLDYFRSLSRYGLSQLTVVFKDGTDIGKVTSAVYSPRLERNIALAMVAVAHAHIGAEVEVVTPSGPTRATVVERPFYDPRKKLAAA